MSSYDAVGPVLIVGEASEHIIAAIKKLNPTAEIQPLGAYIRVLVPKRCYLTKKEVEASMGRAFNLPESLELVMPSFKGNMTCTHDQVEWSFKE
jgi:hypothetical protein